MNSMTHSASPEGLASRLPVLNTKSLSADQRMALAVARIAASRSSLILCLSPNPPEPRRDADGRPMDEPTFVEMLTARINRKGLLHGSWLTARTLGLRWWNRQPWHTSAELVGQTLAHQARPLMRRYPLGTLGVGAALGVILVMTVKVGRPRVMQHIQQQASPWRDRMTTLLWAQVTSAPVQMALAGALAAWLADQGSRHAQDAAPRAKAATSPAPSRPE